MGIFSRTPAIDPQDAATQRAEDTSTIVLDVRQPGEWAAGHIPGAVHIPLDQLARRVDELPGDQPIIVACRSGARSAKATKFLVDQGRQASNLRGGTQAWLRAGLPLDPPNGRVA